MCPLLCCPIRGKSAVSGGSISYVAIVWGSLRGTGRATSLLCEVNIEYLMFLGCQSVICAAGAYPDNRVPRKVLIYYRNPDPQTECRTLTLMDQYGG